MHHSLLAASSSATDQPTRNQLGTLNGCHIPCLLNILGAPLFNYVYVGLVGMPDYFYVLRHGQ